MRQMWRLRGKAGSFGKYMKLNSPRQFWTFSSLTREPSFYYFCAERFMSEALKIQEPEAEECQEGARPIIPAEGPVAKKLPPESGKDLARLVMMRGKAVVNAKGEIHYQVGVILGKDRALELQWTGMEPHDLPQGELKISRRNCDWSLSTREFNFDGRPVIGAKNPAAIPTDLKRQVKVDYQQWITDAANMLEKAADEDLHIKLQGNETIDDKMTEQTRRSILACLKKPPILKL